MADAAVATKWRYKADYFEYCNCAFGCPCNFSGFPTTGQCRAVVVYRITEGTCGDVDLAGGIIAFAVEWPKAIHDGNGVAAVFFDPGTTQQQQEAMAAIFTNQYGGLPHEIIAGTLSTVLGPFVEKIEISGSKTKASIKIGNKVSAQMTPFVSPVEPHEEQEVHTVLPTGFIFKDGMAARNVAQNVDLEGLKFSDADTNAYYSVVEHSN